MKPFLTLFNLPFLFICGSLFFLQPSYSQQAYENNKQLDCYIRDAASDGYVCNGAEPSCVSYLTFRAQPPYNSASKIGLLMNSDPTLIVQLNNIIGVDEILPTDNLVIVPISNCSCSGKFYQHSTSYTFKTEYENYYTLANDTLQGLTTCQSLMDGNPSHESRNLSAGMTVEVPLRCACPTKNQTDKGFKFLLSYLIDWGDDISTISEAFGADEQSTLDGNELSETDLIFPFTTLLIPLQTKPTYSTGVKSPPTPPPPFIATPGPIDKGSNSSSSNKKVLYIGIGIGSFVLVAMILGFLYLFLVRRGSQSKNSSVPTDYTATAHKDSESGLLSPRNVRLLIDSSLKVYGFVDLQAATGHFSEANKIRGSMYRGVINGDNAAIKMMKGDALKEINVLKQIFHSSIIRLSGYCMHEGNVYFVYEFAENGSLSDWLHDEKSRKIPGVRLSWKQRIQIAYDAADGLNYLHNYATPPYIHRDLKSSNILLNGSFRAKIANFGMARAVESEEMEGAEQGLQLTRHVVGTQGYMAPEYLENGVVTPKMDVFAFGVVMLELLSGKEAATFSKTGGLLLFASVNQVLEGENVREKLKGFIDPSLGNEYPMDLAFSFAVLANDCVTQDVNSRPTMFDVHVALSKILSSSLDWDPFDEF